jgi:hypothetical protein
MAQCSKNAFELDLYSGAGDGNRTRTISLGSCAIRAVVRPDLRGGMSASDRERPLVTGVNGTLMARRAAVWPELMATSWSSPVLLDSRRPSGRGRCVKAREATACGLALTRRTRPRQSSSEEDARRLNSLRPEAGMPNVALPERAEGRQFDPAPDHQFWTSVKCSQLADPVEAWQRPNQEA